MGVWDPHRYRVPGIRALVVTAIVASLASIGCAPAQSTAAPPATTAASLSPTLVVETQAPAPTASPPPESPAPRSEAPASSPDASGTFTSTHYRYRITLPPGSGSGAWGSAQRPWDGRQLLVRAGPYLDRTLLPEGGFFLAGTPTAKDLDAFTAEIITVFRGNGCADPTEIRNIEINGVAARAYNQNCPEGLRPDRVVMVNDGYGILAFMTANPAARATSLDRVIELLGGLEWLAEPA